MTGSWNESSGSGRSDEHQGDPLPLPPEAADDGWPSFEDALRTHGFDVAPPSLSEEEPVYADASESPSAEPLTAEADAGAAEPAADTTVAVEPEADAATEPQPESATDAAPVAGDDADAPVLPDVGQPAASWSDSLADATSSVSSGTAASGWTEPEEPAAAPGSVFGFADPAEAAPRVWGDASETASDADRWWLEPSDHTTLVLPQPAAVAQPAAAAEAWPDGTTWASEASPAHGEPEPQGTVANAPQTLPDHRPPTPPPSLFARRGAGARFARPATETSALPTTREEAPEAAPEQAAPTPPTTETEAFAPWGFQPPGDPDVPAPATTQSSGADFWTDPQPAQPHDGSYVATVDENWASPGFAPAEQLAEANGQPYAFGAGSLAPYEATPTPYDAAPAPSGPAEPSVDWYEAAALEVVGTSTAEDSSSTEFVGYDDGAPRESHVESAAPAAAAEPHELAELASASESGLPVEAPSAPGAEATSAHDDSLVDDPWASQAFLDRIAEAPREPFAFELSQRQKEAAAETVSTKTKPAGAAGLTDSADDAWPALTADAWPHSTADGWPDRGSADTWSAALPPDTVAPEVPAAAAAPAHDAEPDAWDAASAPTTPFAHDAEPDAWDAALATLAPPAEAPAEAEADTEPEAATATASTPAHDTAPHAEPEAGTATDAPDTAAPAQALLESETETGPFSRYAATSASGAAAPAAHAAGSDLWQLVGDPAAAATEPAAADKRSFDPVSIFLTVLVAIVIVALLLGFLVFAGGLLGH